jgi:hypothetical protein
MHMWKLMVGFVIFAVLAVFLLMKGGADVDMSGEKHGLETTEHASPEPAAATSEVASVVAPAASAEPASAAASAP